MRRRQAIKILWMMPLVSHKCRTIMRALRKFTNGKARTVRTKRIIRRKTWIPLDGTRDIVRH